MIATRLNFNALVQACVAAARALVLTRDLGMFEKARDELLKTRTISF